MEEEEECGSTCAWSEISRSSLGRKNGLYRSRLHLQPCTASVLMLQSFNFLPLDGAHGDSSTRGHSKQEVIEYYIKTVQRVLGKWDYSFSNVQNATLLFPLGNTKHWLACMDKPGIGVVTKAQMVDYYAQILTKVLGNEKDAQMRIYHVSWKSFCCEIDEESTSNLASVPGVLSFQPDKSYDSDNKNYGGFTLS